MLVMNTFNPMTYFKSQEQSQEEQSQSESDLEDSVPVEYIIRTRSQKALASAAAASEPSGSSSEEEQSQSLPSQEQSLPSQDTAQEQQEQKEQSQDTAQEQQEKATSGLSPKRRAAAASYKSIIRTRSQTAAENRAFMTRMFAEIDAFYKLYKKEPSATSSSDDEQAMASFLKSLRDANNAGKLGGQSAIDMVHAHLPWFKFAQEQDQQVSWWNRSMVVRLRINAASVFVLCAYLSMLVGVVHVWERCTKQGKCPEWFLDAGDALTAMENQLRSGASAFTQEAYSLWSRM